MADITLNVLRFRRCNYCTLTHPSFFLLYHHHLHFRRANQPIPAFLPLPSPLLTISSLPPMSNPSSSKDTEGSWRAEGKPGSASKVTWLLFQKSGLHKQFDKAKRSSKKMPTLTNISTTYPTTSSARQSLLRSRSMSHLRQSSPSRSIPPVPPQSQVECHPGQVPGNTQTLIEWIGGLQPVDTSQISEISLATPCFSSADVEGIPAGSEHISPT